MTKVDRLWFKVQFDAIRLTQNEVADRIGMDRGALSRTLNGKRRLQIAEAKKIAGLIRRPLPELLERV